MRCIRVRTCLRFFSHRVTSCMRCLGEVENALYIRSGRVCFAKVRRLQCLWDGSRIGRHNLLPRPQSFDVLCADGEGLSTRMLRPAGMECERSARPKRLVGLGHHPQTARSYSQASARARDFFLPSPSHSNGSQEHDVQCKPNRLEPSFV